MIFYNCKIFTMNQSDKIIDCGYVILENGRITAVAEGTPDDCAGGLDLGGTSLYPGFVDAHTHLGLASSGVGVEGEDFNEDSDPVTPQLRVLDAVNPTDACFADAIAAGVTCCAVSPGSTNTIAGAIIAMKTHGVRADKMLMREIGMKFSLGENPKMTYLNKDAAPVTRMGVAALIREALFKAKRYAKALEDAKNDPELDEPEFDLKCEALLPLLRRETRAHFHCHRSDDIFTAVRIAKEFSLDYVLIHCTEGCLIADELAQENACAVVGPVISDRSKPELAHFTPKNAALLNAAGVKIAICTDHSEVPIQYLPLSAALAVKNGLDPRAALRAITAQAAEIAGIADRVGSIEPGKDADFAVFCGDPLALANDPVMVVADGKIVVDKL
ncbi:MAG: amidohydrolase [Oscillospiraceae bacterium]